MTLTLAAAATLLWTGCATKKYVTTELDAAEARTAGQIGDVATQVEENQTRLDDQQGQEHERRAPYERSPGQDAAGRHVVGYDSVEPIALGLRGHAHDKPCK